MRSALLPLLALAVALLLSTSYATYIDSARLVDNELHVHVYIAKGGAPERLTLYHAPQGNDDLDVILNPSRLRELEATGVVRQLAYIDAQSGWNVLVLPPLPDEGGLLMALYLPQYIELRAEFDRVIREGTGFDHRPERILGQLYPLFLGLVAAGLLLFIFVRAQQNSRRRYPPPA